MFAVTLVLFQEKKTSQKLNKKVNSENKPLTKLYYSFWQQKQK